MKRQALAGLAWTYLGNLIRVGSGLVFGIMLARILGPGPFGQIAVCMVIISIGSIICDMGLGPAIVQQREIRDHDIRFVFTIQCLLGVILTLAVMIAAPLIAMLFSQPETVPVLRLLSLMFVLNCAGQTATQLLQRHMRFKAMQVTQTAATLVGTAAVGLPMALHEWGVWSLVAAQLVSSLLQSVLAYLVVRHEVRPMFRPASAGMLRFSTTVLFTNVVNSIVTNMDAAVVSHYFGEVGTGLYRRMQTLFGQPRDMIVQTLQRVLFAAGSRLQDDPEAIRRSLLMATSAVAMVLFPVFLTIAVTPGCFVGAILGPKWMGAVPLVLPLVLAVLVHALLAVIGPLLWATNRVAVELRLQIFVAITYLVVAPLTARYSLQAFAWGILAVYVLRWSWLLIVVIRLKWVTPAQYGRAMAKPLAVAAVTAAMVFFAIRQMQIMRPGTPAIYLLGISLSLSTLAYFLMAVFHQSLVPASLHGTVASIKSVALSATRAWLSKPAVAE